jgi:WD40 repeat protein
MQEINHTANPFPGLRPFESSETHLFFGRDGQSEELLRRLKRTRFLAVVGTSGSGKSSLVRAGLLPALQGGLMASAGSDWRIAILRPGGDPIGNLARALASPAVLGAREEKGADMQAVMAETTLRRSSLGLVDLVSRARTKVDDNGQPFFPDYENLLVVVDQFEELFRFKQLIEEEKSQEDAAAFVKLLLEAVGQNDEKKIYVVLTMRSDFLGDCSQFFELPEAINNGQYLIPRMTRDERREAISGPVAVGQGAISEPLVNQLLNDVGDNPDQLPILQHALMRTWDHWLGHRNGEPIDIPDYNAIGGMAEALSRHADEAYAELDDAQKTIAEKLFKGLTEKGTDNREIRRPMEIGEICELTGANEAAVIAVVEVFRREGRSFLMPPPTDALTGAPVHLNRESLIDISHESLIRNWDRLKTWVEEEARSARIYSRLAQTAVLHKEGDAGLWRDPDLGVALTWRKDSNPNQVWAKRYHPEFPLAMSFLDESVAAREAQIAGEEARRRKEIKRTRLTALIFAVAFLFSLAMGVYAYGQKNEAQRQGANALRAKDEAVAALTDAREQRTKAETQAGIANRESANASKEREKADKQTEIAEEKRLEAETQSRIADNQLEENRHLLYDANVDLAEQAYKDEDFGKLREVLDSYPRQPGAGTSGRDVLGFEWHRFWRISHAESETLTLDPEIFAVAFSSDGKTLATTSQKIRIKLLDLSKRTEIGVLDGHVEKILRMKFSPDGKMLATASDDGIIVLWDVVHKQKLRTLQTNTRNPHSIEFSPDGKMLAAGCSPDDDHQKLTLWDTASGRELTAVAGFSVAKFSPDGTRLVATGYAGPLKSIDTHPPYREAIHELGGEKISDLAFSPDGKKLVTAATDGTIYWFDLVREKQLGFAGSHQWPTGLAFSPDSKTLAILMGSDSTLHLWETESGAKLGTLNRGGEPIYALTFSDSNTLVTGGGKGVKLWNLPEVLEQLVIKDDSISLRDSISGIARSRIALSPDGTILATVSNGRVKFRDAKTLEERKDSPRLNSSSSEVSSLAFSPDGKLAIGDTDGAVMLWDVNTKKLAELSGQRQQVVSLSFSRDSKKLAVSCSTFTSTVEVWDVSKRRLLKTLRGFSASVWSVAFSKRSETLATGSDDGSVKLWNVVTGKNRLLLSADSDSHSNDYDYDPALPVVFSPDGMTLASGSSDKTVKLWDVITGREKISLKGHSDKVLSLAFSPDGKTLASASSDKTVKLWDPHTGHELATLRGYESKVNFVAFFPDSRTIATAGYDLTVRLWLSATNQKVAAKGKH